MFRWRALDASMAGISPTTDGFVLDTHLGRELDFVCHRLDSTTHVRSYSSNHLQIVGRGARDLHAKGLL